MKQKIFLFGIILTFISCNKKSELNGVWHKIKATELEEIPQVNSREFDGIFNQNLTLEIQADSICFKQGDLSRIVNYTLKHDTLFFLDKNKSQFYWKIISLSNDYLVIERNIGGIYRFDSKLKFEKGKY